MSLPEQRVLVVPPTRRDGEVTLLLLKRAGLDGTICATLPLLGDQLRQGVGVVLLTEDALYDPAMEEVLAVLTQQPPWSEVPVVVLARDAWATVTMTRVLGRLHNVTLLDRPVSARSMLSAVQAALRARQRQYQIRDQLLWQERTQADLRDNDRRKDEFLATLAHELRNPLAPLRNAARLLGAAALQPQQMAWIRGMVERQVGHMARLLEDLLDVSRITQGKLQLRRKPVALPAVVEPALEAARPLIDRKRHQLSVSLPEPAPWLQGDAVRLSQVLSNLLTNAAKYTEPGGRIELCARVDPRQQMLVLEVRDSGIGLPAGAEDRVFEMFTQIDDGAHHAEGGLGIGLALVRGIVELHGGAVGVHSDGPGRGSTFSVTLPLTPAPAPQPPDPEGGSAVAARPLRVLVVDDNADAADTLCALLTHMGHEVRCLYDGTAVLATARAFDPELVLLDIGLPGRSGYEVALELGAHWTGRGAARLVALTGWGAEHDRQRSREAGFDAHLTKPMEPQALEALLAGGVREASTKTG